MPHYHEAIRTFLPIAKQLRVEGHEICFLLSLQDLASQRLCDQLELPKQLIPPLRWGRHLTGGPLQFVQEGLKARRFARQFCAEVQPAILVMTDDRRYVESFLINQAKSRRIPTLVLMWAATNNREAMVAWRQKAVYNRSSTNLQRLLSWLTCWLVPQAVAFDGDRRLLWQPPSAVLGLHLFAAYPKQPWIFGGGLADQVTVIGEYYRTMFIEHGIQPDKIVVTGHPRHDQLYRASKRWQNEDRLTICREIGAPVEKKLIVLGPPPISHILQGTRAGHVSPEQMVAYLREVIDDLLNLSRDYHLLVKIHPRDEGLSLPYLLGHTRDFTVVHRYEIAKLIACSELLVCQGSTIVFDAHILGTPVLTFDFYHTPGYDMWAHAGGVLHVTERTNFLPTIQHILSDEQTQGRLATERQAFRQHYVKYDGKATERIVKLIQSSIDKEV